MSCQIPDFKGLEERLCDRCLGRLYGKLGHGLDNLTRGKALRVAIAEGLGTVDEHYLQDFANERAAERIATQPTIDCWVCEGLLGELAQFAALIVAELADYEYDTFLVGSRADVEITEREQELWERFKLSYPEELKSELNREVGKLVGERTGKPHNLEQPDVVGIIDTRYNDVELQIAPLYLYGRYAKLVRGIPQTKWHCKTCLGRGCDRCQFTGKMYPTSVEELIAAKVIDMTGSSAHSFHGLGREDIDARMLGSGRPFVLEIRTPRRRTLDVAALEREINATASGKVSVSGLRYSSKAEVVKLKTVKADKTYMVQVRFEGTINEAKLNEVERTFKDAIIVQRTPLRVLHRRADKARRRKVIDIKLEHANADGAWFRITGESGLYIKELISGDQGRTTPSLAGFLSANCTVDALDVIEVDYGETVKGYENQLEGAA